MEPFPSFRLEDTDGRVVTEHDLRGQPAVVYLGRHPGWNVCRSYLRRVAEALPQIEDAGGRLVVVTPQETARAQTWREELGLADTILVLADPRRTLYAALGARRPAPLWMLRPRVVGAGLRAVAARERVSVTRGDDTLQQGVDVVTDVQGSIAFLHRPSDPADRTSPDELVGVLRRLGRGSGEGHVVPDPESGTSTVERLS